MPYYPDHTYKWLLTFLSLLIFSSVGHAQATKQLIIPLPDSKIANSLYNKITILDIRADTTNLGMVRVGFFDKRATLIAKPSLSTQINNIFSALIDQTAAKQELMLLIRQISFTEGTGTSNKGFFQMRAALFAKTGDSYHKINQIDTLKVLSASIDVTDTLLRFGSREIKEFISRNLGKVPESAVNYRYTDIAHIDSLEKSKLPVYANNSYVDGLYLTYRSFSLQIPDAPINAERNAIQNDMVTTPDKNGKFKKVKSGSVYALVSKGQLYAATKFGYYPIDKVNGELIFTGRVSIANSPSVVATALFGALGGLISSANTDGIFEIKIDHTNGGYIKLKEIETPTYKEIDY